MHPLSIAIFWGLCLCKDGKISSKLRMLHRQISMVMAAWRSSSRPTTPEFRYLKASYWNSPHILLVQRRISLWLQTADKQQDFTPRQSRCQNDEQKAWCYITLTNSCTPKKPAFVIICSSRGLIFPLWLAKQYKALGSLSVPRNFSPKNMRLW